MLTKETLDQNMFTKERTVLLTAPSFDTNALLTCHLLLMCPLKCFAIDDSCQYCAQHNMPRRQALPFLGLYSNMPPDLSMRFNRPNVCSSTNLRGIPSDKPGLLNSEKVVNLLKEEHLALFS